MPIDIDVSEGIPVRDRRTLRVENRTPKAQKGAQAHLYVFLADTGLVKIGRSRAPLKRKRALESNSGLKLKVVRIFKNQGYREKEIHNALSSHRHQGEWFRDSWNFRDEARALLGDELNFTRPSPVKSRSSIDEAIRAICIKNRTPEQIELWDAARAAYAQYYGGEIGLEELNEIWVRDGSPPLTKKEMSYGP